MPPHGSLFFLLLITALPCTSPLSMMPWPYDMVGPHPNCLPNVIVATVEHALSCARGGLPTIRHNEIRDLTANLLTEVCNDVRIEPELQAVTTEHLTGATANSQDGARLNISANGVWGGRSASMYEFSTPMHPRTRTWHPQPVTRNMSGRRNGHTNSVFVKSSTPPSPHLSWQRQEVWG